MKKLTLSAILLFVVAELYAAGTPAGTVIQSRTRATFTTASGAVVDTVYSNFVSITVAQVGSFNITPAMNSFVTASDSVSADYAVIVTNSGNGTDIGRLSAVSKKGFTVQLYFDANGDGVLQLGEFNAGTITQTSSLPADAQYKLIARVRVPRDESLNGQVDSTTVIVKSTYDTTKTNTAVYLTTIQSADVRGITTGLSVNNPAPSANSQIIFTLTFTNSGSVAANGMTIYNFIPSAYTFVSGTTSQGTFSGGTNPVSWNIGSVAPGGTITITLTLLVNTSVPTGTNLSDSMTVRYTVGANTYTVGTNSPAVIVGGDFGFQLTKHFSSLIKEPADTAVYRFKVQNTGSNNDVGEIQYVSTRGWSWSFYRDANNNQAWDAADVLLTNTNSVLGVDVDSVAAGDSVRIFAVTTNIPRTGSNTVKDTLQVTVVSAADNSKQNSSSVITSVSEPVVAIQISPVPNQPPGAVITYTIGYSNTGSASVNDFVISDITPQFTDYVPNSVIVNGVAVQDNTGGVSITEGPNGSKVIAVSIGTLAAQTSGSIDFKVKIK